MTFFVKIDQRLGSHLPVGLTFSLFDSKLRSLLLGKSVRLGNTFAPCSKEIFRQDLIKIPDNILVLEIFQTHSIVELFVRPPEIFVYPE